MNTGELLTAFLQPVAVGSAAVFILLALVRLTIRRSPALATTRKTLR